MVYFIYNHRLTGEQQLVEAQSIAEDHEILWIGESIDQFTKETGFDQSNLGGLIMLDGKLSFSQDHFEAIEKSKLPIASGKSLISFIESSFLTKPNEMTERDHWKLRKQLQSLFVNSGIKDTLNSETCNPVLSYADFQNVLLDIEDLLAAKMIEQSSRDLIVTLANSWLNTVEFR
jgi:hypothetical protein